jgi:hypothetical protein
MALLFDGFMRKIQAEKSSLFVCYRCLTLNHQKAVYFYSLLIFERHINWSRYDFMIIK